MVPRRSPKRAPAGTPGVKVLITAASLTATLCGWAMLTAGRPEQAAVAASPPAVVMAPAQPTPKLISVGSQPPPVLRAVSAPPQPPVPVAITQSSR